MPSEQPRLSDQFKNEVESAQKLQLNHVQVHEKNVLPTQKDVELEKEHEEFKKSIEEFDPDKNLSHVKTEEKVVLPSKDDIVKEKLPTLAASFDKSELHHVEPVVKHNVEIIEQ